QHGGRIVKQIGDAFMLTFTQPADAVEFGLDILGRVAEESLFPAVHVGAHHGSLLYRDGDYVGACVNLAARVASATGSDQFLITEAVRDRAGDLPGVEFSVLPARYLKGVPDAVRLVDVGLAARTARAQERDPVCGMGLDPAH